MSIVNCCSNCRYYLNPCEMKSKLKVTLPYAYDCEAFAPIKGYATEFIKSLEPCLKIDLPKIKRKIML